MRAILFINLICIPLGLAQERTLGSYARVDLTKYESIACSTNVARIIGIIKYNEETYYELELRCKGRKIRKLLGTEDVLTSKQLSKD